MKFKFYNSGIVLLMVVLLLFNFCATSSPVNLSPASTPVSGVTNFNSLYSGSFVDLTGTKSAGGAGLVAPDVAGWDFRLLATSSAVDCGIGIEPFIGPDALVYGYTQSGATNLTALEISSNDGQYFDLKSVDITTDGYSSGTSHNVRLVGYNGGVAVPGALLVKTVTGASYSGAALVNFDVSGNANFAGVDKFRIETDGTYSISGAIGVDNINATNFRGVLVVSITSFNAIVTDNKPTITWSGISKTDNSRFIIERSSDGFTFGSVANLAAAPVNAGLSQYRFIDEYPAQGNSFYRLKESDQSGRETLLGVRKIFISHLSSAIYPNPVNGASVMLRCSLENIADKSYRVMNTLGQIVSVGVITNNLQQVNIGNLKKGNYLLRISDGTTFRFIRQ